MSSLELKALVRDASQTLEERRGEGAPSTEKGSRRNPIDQVDNVFELLKKENIGEGDIVRAWGTQYHVWQRMRVALKKLSVERIYRLARVIGVFPAELFELILNGYPEEEGEYSFEQYRLRVQDDLDDLTIKK